MKGQSKGRFIPYDEFATTGFIMRKEQFYIFPLYNWQGKVQIDMNDCKAKKKRWCIFYPEHDEKQFAN